MALNAAGIEIPAGLDPFDPQGDMVELAASLAGRVVIPVVNATDRADVVSRLGWTPSPTRPLYVDRADATPGATLERTVNGVDFTPVTSRADVQITTWNFGFTGITTSGWNGLWLTMRADTILLQGAVTRATAWTAGAVSIATLPAEFRPPRKISGVGVEVNTDGTVNPTQDSNAARALSFSAVWHRA